MVTPAAAGSLVSWGPHESERHDREPFVTRHGLGESALFTDDALAALMDRYPRERLQVFTMGTDPLDNTQWAPVDTAGVSGADMLRAAASGRLWIKLMRIDLVDEAYRGLPKEFRSLCKDLVIRIEDFATDDILDDMHIDDPFDLLGLFQGGGLPFRAESAPVHMPNMIWLYRRPILDYWSDHEEALGAIVAHVLVHEIGHHFGLSDADMETIEADAD